MAGLHSGGVRPTPLHCLVIYLSIQVKSIRRRLAEYISYKLLRCGRVCISYVSLHRPKLENSTLAASSLARRLRMTLIA
jgi:hypothetical protein